MGSGKWEVGDGKEMERRWRWEGGRNRLTFIDSEHVKGLREERDYPAE